MEAEKNISSITGESVSHCYQCGKCSAGCPLAIEMDYPPSRIMRMLQYGSRAMDETVLCSKSIWLCLSCETCLARCPQKIDIPKIMDSARGESLRRGIAHRQARDIIAFHRSFLDSVIRTGRLYEVGLILRYKLRTRHLFQDLGLAVRMFFRGKLGLLPHLLKDRHSISGINHDIRIISTEAP